MQQQHRLERLLAILASIVAIVGFAFVLYDRYRPLFDSEEPAAVTSQETESSEAPSDPQDESADTTSQEMDSSESTSDVQEEPLADASVHGSGCVLTIENPLVPLRQDPEPMSQEIVTVPPDDYQPLDHVAGEFAGEEQWWFQIQVEEDIGWISDDTITIAGKTGECP